MSKIGALPLALAAALLTLPARADPYLAGSTWADDECLIAFEFHSDYTFLEYDFIDEEYTGRWQVTSGTLYLYYDNGWTVETAISDSMFAVTYGSDEKGFTCYFVPD